MAVLLYAPKLLMCEPFYRKDHGLCLPYIYSMLRQYSLVHRSETHSRSLICAATLAILPVRCCKAAGTPWMRLPAPLKTSWAACRLASCSKCAAEAIHTMYPHPALTCIWFLQACKQQCTAVLSHLVVCIRAGVRAAGLMQAACACICGR